MKAGKCYRASRSAPACPEVAVDGIKPSTFTTKVINISNMQSDKLPKGHHTADHRSRDSAQQPPLGLCGRRSSSVATSYPTARLIISAQYRTLTFARNHLMSSIEAAPSKASVLVYNPLAYTRIHNEGRICSPPTVTPKMRKCFLAQYYKAGDKSGGNETEL